jgi:triphosphoribosyl-dephospho-CoA synthase
VNAQDVVAAAQLACLLEVSAPKPGNVSPGRHFEDLRYEDFLAAAAAIGEPLAGAASRSLGSTVRLAVEATTRWTRSNTNLGIVLLLAPLTRAALLVGPPDGGPHSRSGPPEGGPHIRDGQSWGPPSGGPFRDRQSWGPPSGGPLHPDGLHISRDRVRAVLEESTVEDARQVYAAIRLASPGGLGRAEAQDVADEPDQTLLEVMRLAADRDGIAREYATGFETTFDVGVPALERARCDGLGWDDAVVEAFLTLLAAAPDTHVSRRAGAARAADVSSQARRVLEAGGVRSDEGRRAVAEFDRGLRDPDHRGNPGTTADLTAAAIFLVLLRHGPPEGGHYVRQGPPEGGHYVRRT